MLTTGKYYNLKFSEEDTDVEEYIEGMAKLAGIYKLIGTGKIPYGNKDISLCNIFEYYLFKSFDNNKIIEVYRDCDKYQSLAFCARDKLNPDRYSDYLEYGSLEFPEFAGPHCDICMNVEIKEVENIDDEEEE